MPEDTSIKSGTLIHWQTNFAEGLKLKQNKALNFAPGFFLTLILLFFTSHTPANDDVQRVLEHSVAPEGIVFEIVESDEEALRHILPRIKNAIERIRERFPETEFAVVSHGREEFGLQTEYQQSLPVIHQQVQSLVADNIPVHVCETHASWYGVTAEDFPDYVNVAPTGPGQINLYIEMGYELIVME